MWVTYAAVVVWLVPLACFGQQGLTPFWIVVEDTDRYLGVESEEQTQCPLAAAENNAVWIVPVILGYDSWLEVEVVVGIVEVLIYQG